MKAGSRNTWKQMLRVLLTSLFLSVLVFVFAAQPFEVEGKSMERYLNDGDCVLVNKLLMGARILTRFDVNDPRMTCIRLPGFRKAQAGDVMVFNSPYGRGRKSIEFDYDEVFIKRCLGLPGDVVEIRNGVFLSNGLNPKGFSSYDRSLWLSSSDTTLMAKGVVLDTAFKPGGSNWNIRNLGPVTVPAKGSGIVLTAENLPLFSRVIEFETGELPYLSGETIKWKGKKLTSYTFQSNWYYLVGDNVLHSNDSRYFGFVPEAYIIGIATHNIKNR